MLESLYPNRTIFIIGGPNLLMQCKDITDMVYVSHRKGSFYADTRLPSQYFQTFRAYSARPSTDKMLNFTEYKNINPFR